MRVSRELLKQRLYAAHELSGGQVVSVLVSRIRKKLGGAASRCAIVDRRGAAIALCRREKDARPLAVAAMWLRLFLRFRDIRRAAVRRDTVTELITAAAGTPALLIFVTMALND